MEAVGVDTVICSYAVQKEKHCERLRDAVRGVNHSYDKLHFRSHQLIHHSISIVVDAMDGYRVS